METELLNHRYRVLRVLGKGGMGRVLLVADELEGGRTVALKNFQPARHAEESLRHFKDEFMLLANLRHPNLAEVYDFGVSESNGEYFFTTAYVQGEDLFTATEHVPFEDQYGIIVQICRGLEYIHSRQIIHHDIKPSNILIHANEGSDPDERYTVKLIDFGLASEFNLSGEEVIRGTVSYLAPEVAANEPVDNRADLYSLGVTLFHVATRELPFTGSSNIEIIRAHLDASPPDPSSIRDDIPEPIETLILKLLEKDPDDRFQSAGQIIRFLNEQTGRTYSVQTKATKESYVYGGRFVGRTEEIEALEEIRRNAFTDAAEEERAPRHVIVTGESGIGKSRLVREFKNRLQIGRILFFEGHCYRDQGPAYGPFLEILRAILTLDGMEGDVSRFRTVTELLELLGVGSRAERVHLSPEEEQLQLFEAVTERILTAGSERPICVHIGDLHWANDETVELLSYLSRNLSLAAAGPDSPQLLLLTTIREGEGRDEEMQALARHLEEEGACRQMRLERLELPAVAELVDSMLGRSRETGKLAERIHEETRGNPFFIEELMKSLLETHRLTVDDGTWRMDEEAQESLAIPSSVQEVFERRVSRLGPAESDVLRTLSVSRRPVTIREFASMTELADEVILERFDALERKQILHVERQPGEAPRYAFFHDLMQETVYTSLDEEDRRELHRRVGHALETLAPEEKGELVTHFVAAGEREKALEYSIQAARENREAFANQKAVEFYRTALGLLPEDAVEKRLNLLEELGGVLALVGQLEKAQNAFDEILATVESNPDCLAPKKTAEIHRHLGRVLESRGRYDESLEVLSSGFRALKEEIRSREGARILNETAAVYIKKGLYDMAISFCRSGLDLMDGMEENLEMAAIYDRMGVALANRGETKEATKKFDRSLTIRQRLNDLQGIAESLANIGTVFVEKGRMDRGIQFFERSLEIEERIGDSRGIAQTASSLGAAYHTLGNDARALEFFRKSFDITQRLGDTAGSVQTLNAMGRLHLDTGNYENALEDLERAMTLTERLGEGQEAAITNSNMGRLHYTLGDLEGANEYAGRALRLVTKRQMKRAEGTCLHLLGRIAARTGDEDEAERYFNGALTIFTKMDHPFETTRVMLDIVDCYLDRGEEDLARMVFHRIENRSREPQLTELTIRTLLSRARLDMVAPRAAVGHLIEAKKLAEGLKRPELVWTIDHRLGGAYEAAGDLQKACDAYVRAMEMIRRIWRRLPETFQATYLADPVRKSVRDDFQRAKNLVLEKRT